MATIGPASADPAVLRAMVGAGMDVARLGLAHGEVGEHLERLARVRQAADDAGRCVAVMADLPGPKIRAAPFPVGGVFLSEGAVVALVPTDAAEAEGVSTEGVIAVDHPGLLDDLYDGDTVVLGDGAIELRVDRVENAANQVIATVVSGGRVQGRPGVSFLPDRVNAGAPTPNDLRLLGAVVEAGVDLVAISFVRCAADVAAVREAAGPDSPLLIAKIETAEALRELDPIPSAPRSTGARRPSARRSEVSPTSWSGH